MNGMAICAGYGGIELGIGLAAREMGCRYGTILYVEREAFAAANLVKKMEAGLLAEAPIWSDLVDFDGRAWHGKVDIVTGGIPCQPFSVAGKQLGIEDERWLWPDFWRVVCEVGAGMFFLEEVPGFIRDGLPHVLTDLAQAGWSAQWHTFTAAEAGASHKRERLFLLAYGPGTRFCGRQDTKADRRDAAQNGGGCIEPERNSSTMVDTTVGEGRRIQQPGVPANIGTGGLEPFCPGPEDTEDWREVLERVPTLEPALAYSRYVHGQPIGVKESKQEVAGREEYLEGSGELQDNRRQNKTLEPAVCRMADGDPNRVDRLRLCGNGVVPVVAAYAFITLAEALGGGLW